MADRPNVLITGAAGRIGSFLTQHLAERYNFVLRACQETTSRFSIMTCGTTAVDRGRIV